MQIKCDYCGNVFQDTMPTCPHCGGTNARVTRTAKDQPLTIEELQQWYKSKGLPPYETTRFFIGQNVQYARAFGIYRNGRNVVVYKNKADGTRAVRYEGEDEAYAVNELFQRLKQEILQQKAHSGSSGNNGGNGGGRRGGQLKSLLTLFAILFGCQLAVGGIFGAFLFINSDNIYEPGYYRNLGHYYYYDEDNNRWFGATIDENYDSFQERCIWSALDFKPNEISYNRLNKKKKLKSIYVSKEYDPSLEYAGIEDFKKSLDYQDFLKGDSIQKGYYSCKDTTYYHISEDKDRDWYYFNRNDNHWYSASYSSLPVELRHSDTCDDFYVTTTWNEETQVTDFETSEFYEMWKEDQERISNESSYDDDSYGNSYDNDNDNSYQWDNNNDSWDSNDTNWDSDW